MILKKLAKLKKIISLLLLITLITPLIVRPILAYDSSTIFSSPGQVFLNYYPDIYRPALEAPEMNLESFVNETFKGLFLGVPLYYISSFFLGSLYYIFMGGFNNLFTDITVLIQSLLALPAGTCLPPPLAFVCTTGSLNQVSPFAAAPIIQDSSLVSVALGWMDGLYQNQPASGIQYLGWVGERLNLVSPVYAQGFGFTSMRAIIPYWRTFRNAAYALFAAALVIIGFMIMFRMKLSPQAVVTIQSALPKVVITLLLVTFSYAIVGFILDLVWFVTMFIFSLMASNNFFINPGNVRDALIRRSVVGFTLYRETFPAIVACFGAVGGLVRNFLTDAGIFSHTIIALIIFIILGFAVVWTIFKTLWMLTKAFIFLVLYTIFAPLWIFAGVFPGVNGFGSWFKEVLAQAIVFPTVATMMLLARIFMLGRATAGVDEIRLPMMGDLSALYATMIAGLGMLLYTPKVATIVQGLMKTIRFQGSSIGEGLAPTLGVAGAAVGFQQEKQTYLSRQATTPGRRFAAAKKARRWGLGRDALREVPRWFS
jgi:hypothetical protein